MLARRAIFTSLLSVAITAHADGVWLHDLSNSKWFTSKDAAAVDFGNMSCDGQLSAGWTSCSIKTIEMLPAPDSYAYVTITYCRPPDPNYNIPCFDSKLGTILRTAVVVDIVRQHETPKSCPVGNPIYPLLGLKNEVLDSQLQIGGTSLRFTYNSLNFFPMAARPPVPRPSILGPTWSTNLHRRMLFEGRPGGVGGALVALDNGFTASFSGTPTALAPDPDGKSKLEFAGTNYRYTDFVRGTEELFDATTGNLNQISWTDGRWINLSYSTSSTPASVAPAAGYLVQAQDNFGRSLSFGYVLPAGGNAATDGQLTQVTSSAGQTLQMAYDAKGNWVSLTWPDGGVRQFLYELPQFPSALTGVMDENQSRYSWFGYDANGLAISTEHANGADRYAVRYVSPPAAAMSEQLDLTNLVLYRYHEWAPPLSPQLADPLGSVNALTAGTILGKTYLTGQTQPAGSGCAASTSSQTFDANGNLASRNDFDGSRSCYVNDLGRNLETSRVEGLAGNASCASVTANGAALPAQSRKISTQWHPDWRLPTKTAEPGRLTTSVYNGQPDPFNGGATASCAPSSATLPDGKPIVVLCKQVEQATTDTDGSAGFSASLAAGVSARVQQWTYNATGQVLTATDPLNHTTNYVYYADTTATHTLGDLQTITNAAGHVTQFTQYDAAGRAQHIVAPNATTTDVVYRPRGQVASVSVTPAGGTARVTNYAYDLVGQLQTLTPPDGTTLQYRYDAVHRLIGITDAAGNTVSYTLDAKGNRIGEQIKDPSGQLARSITRSIDALNRVQQVTGSAQ